MKALIVDDERLARVELRRLLTPFKEIKIVGEAVNAEDALNKITELRPEIIFLDIQMPGKNGFQLLEELDSVPIVVFTTAYDEYALKAFEYNALDYLLKPIEPKRLEDSIKKILDSDRCWFVKLSNIKLFESEGNYVRLYFDENKPLILRTLNYLDERLDDKTFFRANRKHIINLKWVEGIDPWLNGGLLVRLKGGNKIEVSRRQAVKFKDIMSL